VKLRILFLGLFLSSSFLTFSQDGVVGQGRFCKICTGSRSYANYVSLYQMDGGVDVLLMTNHGSRSGGMRKIGKPKTAHSIFLRLGAEYNFKYPILAFKVGIAYQPIKFPYYKAPFITKALGTLNFEFNFLPYVKGEFKSYALRPEAGFIIPFFVRLVKETSVVRALQFKINYGYNFHKNNITPSFMSQHFITAGLVWKTDRVVY